MAQTGTHPHLSLQMIWNNLCSNGRTSCIDNNQMNRWWSNKCRIEFSIHWYQNYQPNIFCSRQTISSMAYPMSNPMQHTNDEEIFFFTIQKCVRWICGGGTGAELNSRSVDIKITNRTYFPKMKVSLKWNIRCLIRCKIPLIQEKNVLNFKNMSRESVVVEQVQNWILYPLISKLPTEHILRQRNSLFNGISNTISYVRYHWWRKFFSNLKTYPVNQWWRNRYRIEFSIH
jgi:hypothetical protein